MARKLFFLLPVALFAVLVTAFAIGLRHDPHLLPSALIDRPAPDFALPGLYESANGLTRNDLDGRVTLVNFFASWCVPCKTETPLLAKFYRTQKGKVALVGLDENDTVGNATSFTRAYGVSYPVGWDPHFTVASAFGVNALPQTFFLNARHQIVDRIFGAVTLASLNRGIALATSGG